MPLRMNGKLHQAVNVYFNAKYYAFILPHYFGSVNGIISDFSVDNFFLKGFLKGNDQIL